MRVSLPRPLKAKDLDIVIQKSHLKIAVRGQAPIIDGELHRVVKVDESFWTIGFFFLICASKFAYSPC